MLSEGRAGVLLTRGGRALAIRLGLTELAGILTEASPATGDVLLFVLPTYRPDGRSVLPIPLDPAPLSFPVPDFAAVPVPATPDLDPGEPEAPG